ncbi:MAG: TonB-dependent receptor P3 [Parabacteroides distasonis]
MHTDIVNRWQNPGDQTDVPRLDASKSADFNAQSDRWLLNANYLSMKSLTFAYTLPKALTSKIDMKNVRVSLSGENLFILSAKKGMDPQQQFSGVVNNAHVPARSFTFGLNVTF